MTKPVNHSDLTSRPLHNLITDSQRESTLSPPTVNRRRFIHGLGTGAAALSLAACGGDDSKWHDGADQGAVTFTHGVASGDPLSDRVILWTRVVPRAHQALVKVTWRMATDAAMSTIISQGEATTAAANDHTLKVDVDKLTPNTVYYYQFECQGVKSRIGKTKTLPTGDVTKVKLAVFSCANYPAGYFHAYADAANRDDIDVCVHLGDYIYEYGRTVLVTTDIGLTEETAYASANAAALGREVEPATEITDISSYRRRYAQYRSDPDLQELHASAPMISVWDDHEFCNDAYREGAENHQPTEGDWEARKLAAMTAYHEWLPTRNSVINNITRSFDFGNLLSLHMMDTRIIGRDQPLDYGNYVQADGGFNGLGFFRDLLNQDRALLGINQQNWLATQLQQSTATWQVLGQQVLMGKMWIPSPLLLNFNDPAAGVPVTTYFEIVAKQQQAPDTLTDTEKYILAQPAIPYNLDAWDGYSAARDNVLSLAKANNANLIVLAGDTHNAWANDLQDRQGDAVGVEFATSSVSSPGFEEYLADIPPAQFAAALPQLVQGGTLKYTNTSERGYMVITLTPSECQSEWVFVSDILKPTYSAEVGKTLTVKVGDNKIA